MPGGASQEGRPQTGPDVLTVSRGPPKEQCPLRPQRTGRMGGDTQPPPRREDNVTEETEAFSSFLPPWEGKVDLLGLTGTLEGRLGRGSSCPPD